MTGVLTFLIGVLTLAGIYAILTMLLNLLAGWGGMWDLGMAGMLAVGAYVFVITTQTTHSDVALTPGWPMWVGLILASLAGGAVALLIGTPSLRVRGLYFMITTLAFAEVIRQLVINLEPVTRGTRGFNQFDRPLQSMLGLQGISYRLAFLGLVWLLALVGYIVMTRIARAPLGELLRGFRDNDPLALALGKHTNRRRISVYVFSGLIIGGVVAPLYVWYIQSVVPSLFSQDITFLAWAALAIGGFASMRGPLIGAALLVLLLESAGLLQGSIPSRYIVLLSSARFIILGFVLIGVMRFRPQGIISEKQDFARSRMPATGS
jgi:branched-chain amino acid transport system permease protein